MSLNGLDPSVAACSPQDFATNPYVFKYAIMCLKSMLPVMQRQIGRC